MSYPHLGTLHAAHRQQEVEWNLNFPSSLKVIERIYTQEQKRLGMDAYEYAKYKNTLDSGDTEFRYQVGY